MPVEFTRIFTHPRFERLDEQEKQRVYENTLLALRCVENYFTHGAKGGLFPLDIAFLVWENVLSVEYDIHDSERMTYGEDIGAVQEEIHRYREIEEILIDALEQVHYEKMEMLSKLMDSKEVRF